MSIDAVSPSGVSGLQVVTLAGMIEPPVAKRVPTTRERHGDVVVDEYAWLRQKDDPEVIAYLEAENTYTDQALAHTKELQESLFDEIRARIQETDLSVP